MADRRSRGHSSEVSWLNLHRAFALGMKISGNLSSTAGIWGFTILWNLMDGYLLMHGSRSNSAPVLFAYLFFGFGLLLLVLATYVTISRFRYGWPVLELQTFASVPGGVLTGTIRIPKPLVYREGIQLCLACMRGVVRGGLSNDPVEMLTVLWEDRCILDRFSPGDTVGQICVSGTRDDHRATRFTRYRARHRDVHAATTDVLRRHSRHYSQNRRPA